MQQTKSGSYIENEKGELKPNSKDEIMKAKREKKNKEVNNAK